LHTAASYELQATTTLGRRHLLLGLLREGEGVAARFLENLGADPGNIRTQVIRMVGSTETVARAWGGAAAGSNRDAHASGYGTNLTKLAEDVSLRKKREERLREKK